MQVISCRLSAEIGSAQTDREGADPAADDRRTARWLGHFERELRKALEEAGNRDPRLGAGEVGPEAEVESVAEREVGVGSPPHWHPRWHPPLEAPWIQAPSSLLLLAGAAAGLVLLRGRATG
jgi:hypothetical protein